jgi:phage-related baseplate assembly protein
MAGLVARATMAQLLAKGLAVAEAIGLPVSSWSPGDPTRSTYLYLAEVLAELEVVVYTYVAGGSLELGLEAVNEATDDDARTLAASWLKRTAWEVFGTEAVAATYAETDVVLTNTGGGYYELVAGDLTVKNSVSGKTYHSLTAGILTPGGTLTVRVVADEAGSDSSATPGEITELVTGLLGVTCTNPAAALALDEEQPDALVERAKAKLGALSPNGPRDAYRYVALNPTLTGVTNVTRARSVGDSTTGRVRLYIAGPSGPVSEADRLAVEAAVVKWATPLCITLSVLNASAVPVNIVYEAWLYSSVNEDATAVAAKIKVELGAMFAARPISGDIIPPATGRLYRSLVKTTIQKTYKGFTFRVVVTTPAADVDIFTNEVPVIGTVTGTIHFVRDP